MSSFLNDFQFGQRFTQHVIEIISDALRVPTDCIRVASDEDDMRRNTDIFAFVDLPRGKVMRVAVRVRHHRYIRRYADEFTIRLARPSLAPTEMQKMLARWGDIIVYGFESAPDSDRLWPWFVGNTEILREYIGAHGYFDRRDNADGSSQLAGFRLDDMPLAFLITSGGHDELDRTDPWQKCKNPRCYPPYWAERSLVAPLTDDYHFGAGYWRVCMFCGTRWRSGWVAPLTRTVEETRRRLGAQSHLPEVM